MPTPTSCVLCHPVVLATFLGALALAGCGADKEAATQVAVKVNKEEISVHQINNVLNRAGNLPPDQMKTASRQVLERLVDQELLVQKAIEKKLDREPKAMRALEEARRDILARGYMESIVTGTAKATPEEIAEYYAKRPELFAERRIYNLQEMTIAGDSANLLPKLQEQLGKTRNLSGIVAWLTSQNIPFGGNVTTKAAEELPLELLPRFHQMKDGQIGVLPAKDGVLMVQLTASRTEPVDQKAATPFIEQFLFNQKKIEVSNKELKQLREQAKIEYLGDFAKTEDAPKAAATQPAAPVAAVAPQPAVGTKPAAAAAVPNAAVLEKGIAGLK